MDRVNLLWPWSVGLGEALVPLALCDYGGPYLEGETPSFMDYAADATGPTSEGRAGELLKLPHDGPSGRVSVILPTCVGGGGAFVALKTRRELPEKNTPSGSRVIHLENVAFATNVSQETQLCLSRHRAEQTTFGGYVAICSTLSQRTESSPMQQRGQANVSRNRRLASVSCGSPRHVCLEAHEHFYDPLLRSRHWVDRLL